MEYVPSGDFSELLMAASSCGPDYPGRAPTGLLNEDWILRYSVDMVQAIAWVHAQGFAHRDIKPGNFLLDRSGHLKLCDFSSAAPSATLPPKPTLPPRHPSQTARYGPSTALSPQARATTFLPRCSRLRKRASSSVSSSTTCPISTTFSASTVAPIHHHNLFRLTTRAHTRLVRPTSRLWSFGVMLYEMRFGVLPFFADKMEETYEKIKHTRPRSDSTPPLRAPPSSHCSSAAS